MDFINDSELNKIQEKKNCKMCNTNGSIHTLNQKKKNRSQKSVLNLIFVYFQKL